MCVNTCSLLKNLANSSSASSLNTSSSAGLTTVRSGSRVLSRVLGFCLGGASCGTIGHAVRIETVRAAASAPQRQSENQRQRAQHSEARVVNQNTNRGSRTQ